MKTITCYYDETDHSGKAWDEAVKKARSELPVEERATVQIICLPESLRGGEFNGCSNMPSLQRRPVTETGR
jgi:hypothetical protein